MDYLTGSPVPEPIGHQSIHPVIVGREEPFGRERERGGSYKKNEWFRGREREAHSIRLVVRVERSKTDLM